ncbi:hypothetical protein GCM10010954_38910 [Halobacillus andaensis]|uniref:Uncharacterized protein n=1 Tax=Halobacillus andaensis TaxID=1176239 RepID=A0A917BCU5_HALAA|nr:hypothetical protein [Halobacillus andaensis]MBP2006720.1 hypothetical protein [Halobacillus andaensis]GGF36145.1 hypothetical protein GCM10010954_38910 [Halobacillus andaensis]
MPTFIANDYLVKDGKVVSPGHEIEISEEQAVKLEDKVKASPIPSPTTKREDGNDASK